jgi:hypothetical protein
MTLQPLPSGLPYSIYEENFVFCFSSVLQRQRILVALEKSSNYQFMALEAGRWKGCRGGNESVLV